MDKLKEVIENERRRNPKEFMDAERNGELLHYLSPAMKKANINPALLNQYCKERQKPHEKDAVQQVEVFITTVSSALDETLYEPYYHSHTPPNNMGIADVMASYRANGRIRTTLKKLKVVCAFGSLLCFGVGVRYLTSRYLLHAGAFMFAAADLLRISYNSYDKKYCSLFLEMVGGNVSKLTDTIFKFAKSVVGMSEPHDDPLIKLQSEILWSNLMQDTLALTLYKKVRAELYCCGFFMVLVLIVVSSSQYSFKSPRRNTARATALCHARICIMSLLY
jgi:hypothetical protein